MTGKRHHGTAGPVIALSYLALYAYGLGLGVLWGDIAAMVFDQIPKARALLDIPDGHALNYVPLLGVPAVQYERTVQKGAADVWVI